MDLAFWIQSGAFTIVVGWIEVTHRSAIRAHDKRATEWQLAAQAEAKRNDELVAQLLHINNAVKAGAS